MWPMVVRWQEGVAAVHHSLRLSAGLTSLAAAAAAAAAGRLQH